MTWATEILDRMKAGTHEVPPLVEALELGLLDDWGEGWVRKSWQPRAHLLHPDGSMFGGYMAALFDQVFSFAAMTVLADDERVRTISLNVNFVSVSMREDIVLEARLIRRTRCLMTLEASLLSVGGALRCRAVCQQMILPRE